MQLKILKKVSWVIKTPIYKSLFANNCLVLQAKKLTFEIEDIISQKEQNLRHKVNCEETPTATRLICKTTAVTWVKFYQRKNGKGECLIFIPHHNRLKIWKNRDQFYPFLEKLFLLPSQKQNFYCFSYGIQNKLLSSIS